MKSIRTNPTVHAAEGDERIRTAVCVVPSDLAYGAIRWAEEKIATWESLAAAEVAGWPEYARGAKELRELVVAARERWEATRTLPDSELESAALASPEARGGAA